MIRVYVLATQLPFSENIKKSHNQFSYISVAAIITHFFLFLQHGKSICILI